MRLLRRFWPKRLYTQIMLAAAAALLVAQIINAVFLINGLRDRAISDASNILISSADFRAQWGGDRNIRRGRRNVDILRTDTRPNLPSFERNMDLSERAAILLGDRGSGPYISVGEVKELPAELRGRAFRRQNLRQLQRDNESMATQVMLLSFQDENGGWVTISRMIRPLSNRAIWGLIFQTLLIYAILLSVLAIIARRISKPLDQLKDGMVMVGEGRAFSIKANGPHDVRELIENYNDMNARISSLLSEKNVMLGAIGHDLKTPLASLRVRVESIDDDGERQHMIRSIDDMNIMLNDILTLARLGNSSEPSVKTDIAALIETVIDDFPQEADKMTYNPPYSPIAVNIRPALLRRALRNIIDNALRYGGNAIIDTSLKRGKLIITIADDGPGINTEPINPEPINPNNPKAIDKTALERVFEPFERLETSRNKASGGSGLGLTIARAIVRAHGGDITLLNRDSGGLLVTIIMEA